MMFAQIETRLGFDLSPTAILEAPTIARLAEFIRATTGIAASQLLVPLRTSGTGLPLFLMHSRTWPDMYFRHLPQDLKSDRPVFGLQPPPLDGKHRIPRTIASMAADYVTEIRQVQPHGPYFLAGYSFGGRVSFEIAQQLVREGERVSFLGLIDTVFHDTPLEERPWVANARSLSRKVRAVHDLKKLLFEGLRFIRRVAQNRLLICGVGCLIFGFDWGVPFLTSSDPRTTIGFVSGQIEAMSPCPILAILRCSAVREIQNGREDIGDRLLVAD